MRALQRRGCRVNLPRFLIIGAMKAGTTTLYRDLLTNPRVFMPLDKEPDSLGSDAILTPAGLRKYAELFAPQAPHQIGGEASTSYTKLPDVRGVPARVRQVLGTDVKLIYLVREPVSRAISHHAHMLTIGVTREPDFNTDIRRVDKYLNYSRYAMQLEAWHEAFAPPSILIVPFESYVKDRRGWIVRICEHIGVEPRPERVDEEKKFNAGGELFQRKGPAASFARSSIYRRVIRPLLSTESRDKLRKLTLPKADISAKIGPTPETIEWMLEQLAPDRARFEQMTGSARPEWSPDEVRRRLLAATNKTPVSERTG